MASHFDPPIAALDLCVPAVGGVVSHLVASVLPESDTLSLYTILCQEQEGTSHEVSQSLVSNKSLRHCFLHCDIRLNRAVALLAVCRPEGQPQVLDHEEFGMVLVVGVYEVFDLCHLEFSHPQQSLPGMDLVSETKTDLSSSKRHLSIVEIVQSPVIEENTLSCFWPKVSLHVSSRTDLTRKH